MIEDLRVKPKKAAELVADQDLLVLLRADEEANAVP